MAISVALAVGMYPDSLGDVTRWVKDGTLSVRSMNVGSMSGGWLGWGENGKRAMTPEVARRIARSRESPLLLRSS